MQDSFQEMKLTQELLLCSAYENKR